MAINSKRFLALVPMFVYVSIECFSQAFNGKVLDERNNPVQGATIIMQKTDSTNSQATITDEKGCFSFSAVPEHYRITVHHISFKSKVWEDSVRCKTVFLQADRQKLDEVIVTAHVKQVVINENGSLQYDADALSKNHPARNALDLLDGIPVIQKTGDDYSLTGMSSATILINGRSSNLTQEQVKSMLASMSPDRVKNIEVSYSTPFKYGVKGASINVNLAEDKTERTHVSGDLMLEGTIRHYASYVGGGHLMLTSKALSANIGYSLRQTKDKNVFDLVSEHAIGKDVFNIIQQTDTYFKRTEHKLYVDFDWKPTSESSISLLYSANFDKPAANSTACTRTGQNNIMSDSRSNSYNDLHNLSTNYKYRDFKIGCDLSFYKEEEEQVLDYTGHTGMNGLYQQKFFKTKAYLNNENDLRFGTLEYGMEYVYSATDNAKRTVDADNGNKPFASTQRESAFSFYVGFNKRFGKRGLIGVSAQAEYFKSTLDSVLVNKSKVLWNTFSVYPRLTFMYKLGKYGSMQLALSSTKYYPPYWVTASNRTAINYYCFNEGNPELKPYTRYSLNLNYILHSKYIFGVFYEYCNDYYTQLLTQSYNELSAVYKYYNMERNTKVGVMSVLPVKWGASFNTRFTGMLLSMFQKGQVEASSFERQKLSSRISMANTLSLMQNRIVMELSGWYQFPIVQGIYDVGAMCSVSMGLVWRTNIKGLSFSVKCEDVFDTYRMKVSTDVCGQKYAFKNNVDERCLSINVKYNFNGYKGKNKETSTDERLGL